MNRIVVAMIAACTVQCIGVASARADGMDTAAYAMPEALYENGSYKEALLISEQKMREYEGRDDIAYTVCAELAMASAAHLQAYEKCMTYAAIAEQGLARHGSDVDALMQKINSACSIMERATALPVALKTRFCEQLQDYRHKVKAIYDRHKTRRGLRALQYKLEYLLSVVLIFTGIHHQ